MIADQHLRNTNSRIENHNICMQPHLLIVITGNDVGVMNSETVMPPPTHTHTHTPVARLLATLGPAILRKSQYYHNNSC